MKNINVFAALFVAPMSPGENNGCLVPLFREKKERK